MPYHFRPVMPDRAIGRYAIGGERVRTTNLTQAEIATLQGDYFSTWYHGGTISATATSLIAGTANPQMGFNGVVNPSIPSGQSHFFGFRTPAGLVGDALRFRDLRRLTGGELKYYVYTNIPDFVDGRAITIWNENALVPEPAESRFYFLGASPGFTPVVTDGFIRDMDFLPTTSGGGGNTGGTFSDQDSFRLLPLTQRFILEIQNPTNNAADYLLSLKWVEVPLNLVG